MRDEGKKARKSEYPIGDLFLNRWSPRAMASESLDDEDVFALFEAAKWAPSSYNNQPWRFIVARTEKDRKVFINLMGAFNQQWAGKAPVLIVVLAKKTFDHNNKPAATAMFDAGAAWENLALEGTRRGLVVHAMEGFDYEKTRKELGVPDDYAVCCMVAIGKPGKKEDLPKEMQEREKPSERKPLKELLFEGKFGKKLLE